MAGEKNPLYMIVNNNNNKVEEDVVIDPDSFRYFQSFASFTNG